MQPLTDDGHTSNVEAGVFSLRFDDSRLNKCIMSQFVTN